MAALLVHCRLPRADQKPQRLRGRGAGIVLLPLFGRGIRGRVLPPRFMLTAAGLLSCWLSRRWRSAGSTVRCSPKPASRSVTAFEYWQSTLTMIVRHPWLGVGPGNFQDYYTQFKLPAASEEIRDPHNFVLEVWATAGTFAGRPVRGARRAGLADLQAIECGQPCGTPPAGRTTTSHTALIAVGAVWGSVGVSLRPQRVDWCSASSFCSADCWSVRPLWPCFGRGSTPAHYRPGCQHWACWCWPLFVWPPAALAIRV